MHSNEKAKCDLFVCWCRLWQLPTDFEHACVRPGTHARKFLELLVSNRVKRNTLKSNRFWAKPDIERYQLIVLGPPKPDIEPVLLWPDDTYTGQGHPAPPQARPQHPEVQEWSSRRLREWYSWPEWDERGRSDKHRNYRSPATSRWPAQKLIAMIAMINRQQAITTGCIVS